MGVNVLTVVGKQVHVPDLYHQDCTLCTWCSRCCMILSGLRGADGAPDVKPDVVVDVVDQVYGELEGVVDKLAKEAQRGTLPRLVDLWFKLNCHSMATGFHFPQGKKWQNLLLQENLPETPSNHQPQQQQQPQQQRHYQRQQLVSWTHFKLTTFILTFSNGVQGWSEARTTVSYDLRLESCNLHWTSGHKCHSSYPPWLISQPTSHC